MDNEMIERVAKAIKFSKNEVDMAISVIKAMREPTERMIIEGEKELFEHMPEAKDWSLSYTKEAYQSMIDSIINE